MKYRVEILIKGVVEAESKEDAANQLFYDVAWDDTAGCPYNIPDEHREIKVTEILEGEE